MVRPTQTREQVRQLARILGLSEAELLLLAKEASHDATLLSIEHMNTYHAKELLETLRGIQWSRRLAQEVANV